jgi:hypothetical protein
VLVARTRYEYVVDAARPVLEKEATFAAVVPICAQGAVAVLRSILKPDSLLEVSAQVRLIWLEETAVEIRPVGVAGRREPP